MNFKKKAPSGFKSIDKLKHNEAAEEAKALRKAIEYHNYLYYVKNRPRISDEAFDRLFKRLQELEEGFSSLQTEDSPTQRVGAEPVHELEKVDHISPMLSLNALHQQDEVENFHDYICRRIKSKKPTYVLEPKFDGASIEIIYEDGIFKRGVTRGDGQVGEEISANLKTVGALPLRLRDKKDLPRFLAVRGEVLMPKEGFQELNRQRIENGEEPFANPRNAAAGLLRQLDSRKVAGKPLDVFFYDILKADELETDSHWQALEKISNWGLKTNPQNRKSKKMKEIRDYHDSLLEKRDELPYEIDGVVIKLDNFRERQDLGSRHRSPRWATAWKFPPRKETTTLVNIAVQVGRTGMLTPVAQLEPVDVGGVTVSRATLHNESEARKKEVLPGDRVKIERAGDVIPEVLERTEKGKQKKRTPFSMPSQCPSCGSDTEKEGAYWFCPAGLACPAQLAGRIVHYASRPAMDIDGLGEKTAEQLVKKQMVEDMADLYSLRTEDFLKLEKFAEKSARKQVKAIQKNMKPRLDRFLYALGIRHVGSHIAQVIAREFGSLNALKKAGTDDLQASSEIGPEIALSIAHFFQEDANGKVLKKMTSAGLRPKEIKKKGGKQTLKGLTFVLTGELENYTRKEAERLVEDHGGNATSSVSSNTDYVVKGENPGSKLEEGRKHDVKIIDESEFKRLVSGNG